ncbi:MULTISPECIES: threonine synthase [Shewanella]|uniref:Threonine synthase n=1 Tax=Shewanella fidelis TaxID=173509 RepID=A0AAW8NPU2_9GAMM|nr:MULTISPECIES: threonine synthase [Shewanella]MDR8524746.1 threonine synthase [Shewanella fidelis]MDW4810817.1 threonine synthase [Shewanella fidelis]MDW4815404.1 threonine synthase [Shewanella fidelis]MDW4819494.1 threonine synthase [Shewanella fidelis]MDW4822828.1 threonine synthase [Shewanella fidelis]
MQLYNLKHPSQVVSFTEAVKLGLGKDRGLFFPKQIPQLQDIDSLLALPFVERSKKVLGAWLASELGQDTVDRLVERAFNFELPLVKADENLYSLELFHGPTLAFKDFGARFMAQCLNELAQSEKINILTATSGDTGAAVADAFYGLDNINVVVLYPKGKISVLQEKMFTTLGDNIHTVAVQSDFDACQALVKRSFEDLDIRDGLHLNSANSINISRLLAQICYYFEAVAQFKQQNDSDPVIAVPSGNFGNLTAGLFAKAMGLPVKRFVAATNSNDTVPRYLGNGEWLPEPTVATMSNAMDVSEPSNWPRVEAIVAAMNWSLDEIIGLGVSEADTRDSVTALNSAGYLSEPHAAIAALALKQTMSADEKGIFLATAHPAKFNEVVEEILQIELALPDELARVVPKAILSVELNDDFEQLKTHLFKILAV